MVNMYEQTTPKSKFLDQGKRTEDGNGKKLKNAFVPDDGPKSEVLSVNEHVTCNFDKAKANVEIYQHAPEIEPPVLYPYLSYDVAVIQWITSCHIYRMTMHVITLCQQCFF